MYLAKMNVLSIVKIRKNLLTARAIWAFEFQLIQLFDYGLVWLPKSFGPASLWTFLHPLYAILTKKILAIKCSALLRFYYYTKAYGA
jgi:hypothetical protein